MKSSILACTALAATLFAIPAAAQLAGQTGAPNLPTTPRTDRIVQGDEAGETIIVTGSRIRRAGFDTLEPATVISEAYLDSRGLTNIADALNETPGFGVGVNPDGGQSSFGVGQNFVNRFGLGSARTLTLVNGRRFVSTNAPSLFGNTPGLQVDLNVIPSRLVDRIENIAIGGAATYGSDAIAGVVNVILKRDFQGIDVSLRSGITERGDNPRYNASLIVGQNFGGGRGNITAAVSYDRAEGVLSIDRQRFREGILTGTNPTAGTGAAFAGRTPANDGRLNPNVPFNTGNADGIPNSVYIRNGRIFSLTEGGVLLPLASANPTSPNVTPAGFPRGFGANNTLLQFNPNGELVPFNPGTPFGPQNASGGDGFFLNETLPITATLERYTANLNARYEVADRVNMFVESTYYRADALELIDQPIFNATLFGGVSAPLTFSATDPRLTPQARATLAANNVTDFRLSRASRDIINNNASARTEVFRVVGGFEGDFDFAGRTFNFEVSGNYGRSFSKFFQSVLNQQRFVNAINATTNAAGQIVCNPTPTRNAAPGTLAPVADPNCVPLDVFGARRSSPAALAYVTDRTTARATLEQIVFNANVGGDLFSLWAGPVAANIGYEHRVERGDFNPDTFQRTGLGRAVPIGANKGEFNTDEVFGEISIPLASPDNEIPLVRSLIAEGKVRYVDNTVNGGFTAYTLGGLYSPVRGVQFRGNFTRSLRAPSLVELFTPQSPAFNTFPDPCDQINIASGPNPAVRQRNCAAFYQSYGIAPGTFNSTARVATIPVLSGGDPDLANEAANSYTFGVVLQPAFIPRFRLAVDWNRVKVRGNIASLTPANIAEGCYDNPNFDTANPDAGNAFCTLFTRVRGGANNGQLVNDPANPGLRAVFVNGAYIQFKGLTAEVDYNFTLESLGMEDITIDLGGSLFYLDDLQSSNNGVTINPDDGELFNPRYTAQLNLGFTKGNFGLDLQGNYQSGVEFNRTNTVETQDILKLGEYWLFNLSTSYKLRENSFFRFSVSNLFDVDAPFPIAGGGLGAYDYLGRRYTVGVDIRF